MSAPRPVRSPPSAPSTSPPSATPTGGRRAACATAWWRATPIDATAAVVDASEWETSPDGPDPRRDGHAVRDGSTGPRVRRVAAAGWSSVSTPSVPGPPSLAPATAAVNGDPDALPAWRRRTRPFSSCTAGHRRRTAGTAWRARSAETHTLIAPDLRGYGRTDKPRRRLRQAHDGRRRCALDRQLGFDRVAVVGTTAAAGSGTAGPWIARTRSTAWRCLDIAPTRAMWRRMDAVTAKAVLALVLPPAARPAGTPGRRRTSPALPSATSSNAGRTSARAWPAERDEYVRAFSARSAPAPASTTAARPSPTTPTLDDADSPRASPSPRPLLALWGLAGLLGTLPTLDIWREYADDVTGAASRTAATSWRRNSPKRSSTSCARSWPGQDDGGDELRNARGDRSAELGFDAARLPGSTSTSPGTSTTAGWPGWQSSSARRRPDRPHGALRPGATSRPAGRSPTDTLWRIYSMTKPVTSSPRWCCGNGAPFELIDRSAATSPRSPTPRVFAGRLRRRSRSLEPAVEPIRMWHLLTHTSGLTYGFIQRTRSTPSTARPASSSAPRRRRPRPGACDAWASLPLLLPARHRLGLRRLDRRPRPGARGHRRQPLDELSRSSPRPAGHDRHPRSVEGNDVDRLAALYAGDGAGNLLRYDALGDHAL